MFHHESVERKRGPATEESPFPEARRTYFPQGRLCHRLCQVAGEATLEPSEYGSKSLGIEKSKAPVLLCPLHLTSLVSGPIV